MAFTITSPAFRDGDAVPARFTCDGSNAVPQLNVSEPPEGTRSFALIVDDPDAPRGTFTHWVAYDIPADGGDLQAERGKTLQNSFGESGYGGPCPPPGDRAHHYNFTVYAVDVPSLGLRGDSRQALEDALRTHTLATARLTGEYQRTQR